MASSSQDVTFELNGQTVTVAETGSSLLESLRDQLRVRSVKDGCSPQGQCGCCTVLVDGQPRVSCVTPTRRVAGRSITTIEGLADSDEWSEAFCAAGASQCGFCTPGIIVRLAGAETKHGRLDEALVRDAMKAHLCRCTGWQTIVEAAVSKPTRTSSDRSLAIQRADIEGGTPQAVGPMVARGEGGFADDSAPADALVAVRAATGEWVVAETLSEARRAAGKVQGRRTTVDPQPPIRVPDGDWVATLRTSWVDPAYLETDASWCVPGGEPLSALGNGGAFGGKANSEVGEVARHLAGVHRRPVRVLYSREDTIRLGPKRPPFAGGIRADGSGVAVFARTDGIAEAVELVAPGLEVRQIDLPGPPTSAGIRGAGWVEAIVLKSALVDSDELEVLAPSGAVARARVGPEGLVVSVRCGAPLDEVVLRSYCIGAAHMAYSWVTSESLAVDAKGEVHDLTVRSLGVLRAVDTPPISISVEPDDGEPVNGSDAVFAAVAAASWRARGRPSVWPTGS
jgi:xanthine dehydrogenase small subunit